MFLPKDNLTKDLTKDLVLYIMMPWKNVTSPLTRSWKNMEKSCFEDGFTTAGLYLMAHEDLPRDDLIFMYEDYIIDFYLETSLFLALR